MESGKSEWNKERKVGEEWEKKIGLLDLIYISFTAATTTVWGQYCVLANAIFLH